MKRWDVFFPITGIAHVSVDAETQQEAIDAALQSGKFTNESLDTWDVHRHVTTGNVYHGMLNHAYAQERGNMTTPGELEA